MKVATINRGIFEKYFLAVFMVFMLGVFPILYLYYTTIIYRTWADWFSNCAILIPFFVVFLGGTIFFIVMSLKRPKKYTAVLLDKKINKNDNLALFFEVNGFKDKYMFCTVKKDNNFKVGDYYLLTIKEIFEMILYIENNNNEENEVTAFEKIINHKNFALYFGFIVCELILLSLVVLCIVGLVLYTKYFYYYIGVMAMLGLCIYKIYLLFEDNKK